MTASQIIKQRQLSLDARNDQPNDLFVFGGVLQSFFLAPGAVLQVVGLVHHLYELLLFCELLTLEYSRYSAIIVVLDARQHLQIVLVLPRGWRWFGIRLL